MKLKDFKLLTERWNKHIHEEESRVLTPGCDWVGLGELAPNQKCRAGDILQAEGEGRGGAAVPMRVIVSKTGEVKAIDNRIFTNPELGDQLEKIVEEGWDVGLDAETKTEPTAADDAAADDADFAGALKQATEDEATEAEAVPGAAPTENLARQIVQTLQQLLVDYAGAPAVQPGEPGSPKGGGESFVDGKFGPLTRKWLRGAITLPANPDADDMIYIPGAEGGEE